MSKPIVLVVNGYGPVLNDRLRMYLDHIKYYILSNDIKAVIFTGGYTHKKSLPNVSEAEVMSNYMKEFLREAEISAYLETSALTTSQNIEYARNMIAIDPDLKDLHVVVACCSSRCKKVSVLARCIFGQRVEVLSVNRGRSDMWFRQTFVNLPLELFELTFPPLHWYRMSHLKRKHNRL